MYRVAIQIKELISSNVTSAIDSASNPAKMLKQLQREVEEAIISLEGERTLTRQRKSRIEAQIAQNELREADWSDKAKTAMDHDREDLARQALLAREDCRETIAQLKADHEKCDAELIEIDQAIHELEAKRAETRERLRNQLEADGASSSATAAGAMSKADQKLDRISQLEKRTAFATEDSEGSRSNAAVDREIEEMRRSKTIDAEMEKLRGKGAKKKAK